MRKAKKIKKAERLEIAILLEKSYSVRAIARALGRSPNSISYEVKNNSTNGIYDPKKAQNKARLKLRFRRLQFAKINDDPRIYRYVTERLRWYWNPDEISGVMRQEGQPFYLSKTALYQWLRTGRGSYWCQYLYSRRDVVKKRDKDKLKRVMIPERVSIKARYEGANNRSRYGHFEEDTLVSGRQGSGAAAVMCDRRARLVLIKKLDTLSPCEHVEALEKLMNEVRVKSLTFDNGIENKYHKQLGVPTFFCDPYSSWQKGSVENANKMIRRFIPKGTNLSKVSQEKLDWVAGIINRKPRKILGYRSALEVAGRAGLLLNQSMQLS